MALRTRVAAAVLAVALGACAPASASGGDGRTVNVRIHYSRFGPATFAVEPGETVTFVVQNTDPIDHEFLIGDAASQLAHERGTEAFHPPRSGEMTVPAGETLSTTVTFGTEDLLLGCHLPGHWNYGMSGIIEVG